MVVMWGKLLFSNRIIVEIATRMMICEGATGGHCAFVSSGRISFVEGNRGCSPPATDLDNQRGSLCIRGWLTEATKFRQPNLSVSTEHSS